MEDTEIDIRAIVGVLRRHIRLIIVTFVAMVGVAAVVTYSLKPVFTASALVLVDPSRKNLLDPSDVTNAAAADSARVDSEVELVKSETVLLKVIDQLKLISSPEFSYRTGLIAQTLSFLRIREVKDPTSDDILTNVIRSLRDTVSVQRRGLTYIISVQAKSTNPTLAASIANAVASTYIDEQLQAKRDSMLKNRDVIQARVGEWSTAVAKSEDALDQYIAENIRAIEAESGRADLAALSTQLTDQEKARLLLTDQLQIATQSLQAQNYDALLNTLQSQAVTSLEEQRKQVRDSLATAQDGSQLQTDLKAKLEQVESELRDAASAEVSGIQEQVTNAQNAEADLRTKLRTQVLTSNLSSKTLTRIYELQQTATVARNQYQTLILRLNDLDQQAALQIPDSRVAAEASPPDEASFPNTRLILALAGLLGLAAGVALAFLYENYIGGIVSVEQLQSLLRTRASITIPKQREIKGASSLADVTINAPLSIFAESIRKLRVAVDQGLGRLRASENQRRDRGYVLLVTSSAPNEGKTTTALALARAYALSGRTVLLIDCDLRKPSVHRQLAKESNTGLIDFLSKDSDTTTLNDIIQVDELSGIGVLLGSRRSSQATDQLVAGQNFSRLISAAKDSFDIVVLDTPPIGPVVDGIFLAQYADAVVFVARWAVTPQREVRAAMKMLAEALRPTVEVISVLTQNARPSRSYYGRYADYYSDESI